MRVRFRDMIGSFQPRGQFWCLWPELGGDPLLLSPSLGDIVLSNGGTDKGRDDPASLLARMSQDNMHEMHAGAIEYPFSSSRGLRGE